MQKREMIDQYDFSGDHVDKVGYYLHRTISLRLRVCNLIGFSPNVFP